MSVATSSFPARIRVLPCRSGDAMTMRHVRRCGSCLGSQLDHENTCIGTAYDVGYDPRGELRRCTRCVDKNNQENFVKLMAIEALSVETRLHIFSFVQPSAMRSQCRKTWRYFLQGAQYTDNIIWSTNIKVESQIKWGLVWQGQRYRTSVYWALHEDLMDRIIDFLVGAPPDLLTSLARYCEGMENASSRQPPAARRMLDRLLDEQEQRASRRQQTAARRMSSADSRE